jgi:hypothetical protein
MRKLEISIALVCFLAAHMAANAAGVQLRIAPNGNAEIDNGLVQTEISGKPGRKEGFHKWKFAPTGFEMVDVLYGQTDYVKGGLLGEIFDSVTMQDAPGGQLPLSGAYYVINRSGTTADGRAALLDQTATAGGYCLQRQVIFRRDLAVAEVRYVLENERAGRVGSTLRLFTAASPGARGRSQDKGHLIYMPLTSGVVPLDQSIFLDRYLEKYEQETFCVPQPEGSPRPNYARGANKHVLAATWTAMVNPQNGDGMVLVAEPNNFLGYYNSPGITLETVFSPVALATKDRREYTAYVGSFTGAGSAKVTAATPLYVVLEPLQVVSGKLHGTVIPLFAGKLRIGEVELQAAPDKPLVIDATVDKTWKLVAIDTQGAEIGSVDSAGKAQLAAVELPAVNVEPPKFAGDVYVADEKEVAEFLAARDFTVYCDDAASRREKEAARQIAKQWGVGIVWNRTVAEGKVLVVGEPTTNAMANEIGQLRRSLSESWPGNDRGAILVYDNFEATQKPVLLITGSDDRGVERAVHRFNDQFMKDVQPPKGFVAWAPHMDVRVYPSTRPPADAATTIRATAARGEYEPVQVAFTAYDELRDVQVNLSPLKHRETGVEIGKKYLTKFRQSVGPVWVRWINYFPAKPENGWTGVPDPLMDRPDTIVPAGESRGLWLTFVVPEDAVPGMYDAQLTVKSSAGEKSLPIQLEVYDFTIPATGLRGLPYMRMDKIAGEERPEVTDRHLRTLVTNMVEHGMRVLTPGAGEMMRWSFSPQGEFKGFKAEHLEVSDDGKVMLDATQFNWVIEQCDKFAKPFELTYMVPAGVLVNDWGKFRRTLPGRFADKPTIPPTEEKVSKSWYSAEMYELAERYLNRRKMTDRVVIKVADEPQGFDHWYDNACWAIRKTNLPIMTAFNNISWKDAERGLGSQLKLWQPLYMLHSQEFLDRARASGAQVSWYNCGPPPQTSVGAPRAALRSYLWQAAKAKLDVIAWWGIQCWPTQHDVWENRYSHWNSVMYPPHPTKGAITVPGRGNVDNGVLDSIRWELIRDGMDDAAYVIKLRELIAAAEKSGHAEAAAQAQATIDDIWSNVFPTLNDYQPPYDKIVECRDRVARAIVALNHEMQSKKAVAK